MIDKREQKARARYALGGVACAVLTMLAFMPVVLGWPTRVALMVVGFSGVMQVIAQLYAFMHIDLSPQRRDDLMLILFSLLQVGIMFAGTLWVMFNLATRMH